MSVIDSPINTKKDIFSLIRGHSEKFRSFGVNKIGLFGSFVRNEQNSASDIDLLVEFEKDRKTFDNFIQLSFWLEDNLKWPVELVTVESISPYLISYIIQEVEYVTFSS